MKEGLLFNIDGNVFPYDDFAASLYGFNNNYGALCRIARGGMDPTKVGEKSHDCIEVKVVGLDASPKDLMLLYENTVAYAFNDLTNREMDEVIKNIKQERKEHDMKGILPINKFNKEKKVFECVNHAEMVKILRDIKDMPERALPKEVSTILANCLYSSEIPKYFPKEKELEK